MSLRQQLQDLGRKLVAAQHYNRGDKDVSSSGRHDSLFVFHTILSLYHLMWSALWDDKNVSSSGLHLY
jgi:hypothetical protein